MRQMAKWVGSERCINRRFPQAGLPARTAERRLDEWGVMRSEPDASANAARAGRAVAQQAGFGATGRAKVRDGDFPLMWQGRQA